MLSGRQLFIIFDVIGGSFGLLFIYCLWGSLYVICEVIRLIRLTWVI